MLKMIRGVHKCYLCRNSSHVLSATTLQHHYNKNFGILNKELPTYNTVENSKWPIFTLSIYLASFCIVNSKYWVSFSVHILNIPLTDEKFESCIQDKCYNKPHKQVKILSRTCLSKTRIKSAIINFVKAISCSVTTHFSTKQRLAVIYVQVFST